MAALGEESNLRLLFGTGSGEFAGRVAEELLVDRVRSVVLGFSSVELSELEDEDVLAFF